MNDDPSRPGTDPILSIPCAAGGCGRGESHAQSVTDWLKGLFGRGTESEPASANGRNGPEDPLAARPEASSMMRNLLEFVDLRVEDVMVPRAEIVAIDEDASVHDLLRRFMEANHSRLPVYRETLDDPVGMVHIKDFLRWLTERSGAKRAAKPGRAWRTSSAGEAAVALPEADLGTTVKQTGILRPLLFVPPSMRAADLLVKMQSTRSHMAIVVDEYGGTDGLVSIEDLVEEIVGDIADEHDEDEAELIKPRRGGRVSGRCQGADRGRRGGAGPEPLARGARGGCRQPGRPHRVDAGPGAGARRASAPSRRHRAGDPRGRSAPGEKDPHPYPAEAAAAAPQGDGRAGLNGRSTG
jgi:Mg2+/Co2+ transporter CorC